MKKLFSYCILVLSILLIAGSSAWASGLFLPAPDLSRKLEPSNPSVVLRQRAVLINPGAIPNDHPSDSIQLNLFEDAKYVANRKRVASGRGILLWTGTLAGAEKGEVIIIAKNQRVSATILLSSVIYQIRPLNQKLHLIREIKRQALSVPEKAPPGVHPHEWKMIELANREREIEGVPPLEHNDKLSASSRNHAVDMARSNYFSHEPSNGRKFYQRIFDTGYSVSKCAENIAAGFSDPAEVFESWMHNQEHRANILNTAFTEIGVGYAFSRNSCFTHYWAQDLGAAKRQVTSAAMNIIRKPARFISLSPASPSDRTGSGG